MALAPQHCDAEVIVVDNGSEIDLTPFQRDFPWLRVVHLTQRGAGLARNAGVAASSAEVLAFLDCDCLPEPDWVARAAQFVEQDTIIGGRVETFHEAGDPSQPTPAQLFERVFAFDNARYVQRLGFSVTANLVTTRRVFDRVGPFLAGVPEDKEWCQRAGRLGVALRYDPALLVYHPTRADWPALCRKYRRVVAEGYALWPGSSVAWVTHAILTGLSPLRDTLKVLLTERLTGWRQRGHCLWALYKLRVSRALWMIGQLNRSAR